MSFLSIFQDTINRQGFLADNAQFEAARHLDLIYNLAQKINESQYTVLSLISNFLSGKDTDTLGCYLWGDVGRGKTFLMDMFFKYLPMENKARFHFNHFMHQIHDRLKEVKGKKDPLKIVAKDIAAKYRIICLDEFHVSDITDAMLLYGLLQQLYKHKVLLVMTSNIPPDELYKNGLQRSRFLPAIELIKKHSVVVNVNGDTDYRLNDNAGNETYYAPVSANTDKILDQRFSVLADGTIKDSVSITIQGRPIDTRKIADNVVWFEFESLCEGPRAASDYIQIASMFKIVFISNVYEMTEQHDDVARRFISLIDEFYDQEIRLFVSATRLPAYLYSGKRFQFEFQRTTSRLEEMRTKNYQLMEKEQVKYEFIGSGG